MPQTCASTPLSHSFVRFVPSRIKPLLFKPSLLEWSCFLWLHFVQPEMFFSQHQGSCLSMADFGLEEGSPKVFDWGSLQTHSGSLHPGGKVGFCL